MIAFKVFFALAFVVAAIFAVEEEKDLEAAGGHLLGYGAGLGYGGYGGYGAGLYGGGYGGYGLYGGYGRYGFGNGYGLGYGRGYGYGLYGR